MSGAVYVQREPIDVIKRSAKALLVPYLITIVVCVLMAFVFGNMEQVHAYCKGLLFPDGIRGDNLVFAGWPSVEAMWFFPAMFCCRSFYSIIMKYASKYTVVLCASIQLVSVLIGRFLFNLPFGILVGCSVLFFFAIGRMLTKFAGGGLFESRKLLLLVFLNLWILMIWKSHFSVMYFHYNAESYLVDAFVAIGATWVVYRIAKYIDNCRLLNLIGRETLLILCCHEIIRQLISDLAFNGICFGVYRGAVVLIMGTILLSGIAIAVKQVIVKYRIKQN